MPDRVDFNGDLSSCDYDDREWVQCWACHGEGCFDAHDEDPVNYAPNELLERCDECKGRGGWLE